MMTLNSEFPLILPGYFSEEIKARQYAHVTLRGGFPLDDNKKYIINVFAAGATITPAAGTNAGGTNHAGVGTSIEFAPRNGALRGILSYGYAPTAVRGSERGGQGVALSVELNLEPREEGLRHAPPYTQQGLRWLLGPLSP
jgi:hypothetical protein